MTNVSKPDNYNYLFKFIVIGDSSVGKSCLISQFTEEKFSEEMDSTIGVEFGCKTIKVDNIGIKLQIWDTAGQETFKSITRSYYRGSIGGILVFDVTKRESFLSIKKWLGEIKNNSNEQIELMLIGNKCDLEDNREVNTEQAEQYALEHQLEYVETSAKIGKNVNMLFERVASKILKRIQTKNIDLDKNVNGIKVCHVEEQKKKSKPSKCC